MRSIKYTTLVLVVFGLILFLPSNSSAQEVRATGNITEASSQLIYFYNIIAGPIIQVTNTNDTEGVWIHVQIFRNYDVDGDDPTPPTLCDERDFIDFLTPNDTHYYELYHPNFTKNIGETEEDAAETTSIDLDFGPNAGFAVITPVVSESDLTAISFQHLIGTYYHEELAFANAMGRDAVDFATGDKLPDDTPLDGTTNGFVLLQPEELVFNYSTDGGEHDITGFVFKDTYGPPGLLGYAVEPGDASWTPFIFDFKEDVTSCGVRQINCFVSLGLNEDIDHLSSFIFDNDLLCGGYTISEGQIPDTFEFFSYWVRMFVSGLDGHENLVALLTTDDVTYTNFWMNTRK